jgi:GDP-L-fucose synthase
MGWRYTTELEEGIQRTYNWFLDNLENFKQVKM